jgi:hypothetical protein
MLEMNGMAAFTSDNSKVDDRKAYVSFLFRLLKFLQKEY